MGWHDLPVIRVKRSGWIEKVRFIDDGGDRLFLVVETFGAIAAVKSDSYDSAYEAYIDECPTIEEGDLPFAYGFDSEEDYQSFRAIADSDGLEAAYAKFPELKDGNSVSEYPYIVEGYQYQANASGTGIVSVDENLLILEWCDRSWTNPF